MNPRAWDGADNLIGFMGAMHLGGPKGGASGTRSNGWHQQSGPGLVMAGGQLDIMDASHLSGATNGYMTPMLHTVDATTNGHIHDGQLPTTYGIQSMGWGGQAIPDNPGFKAPWFGKNRGGRGNGNGNGNSRGRGRGRNGQQSTNGRNGRSGGNGRRPWGNGSYEDGSADEISVDSLVSIITGIMSTQQLTDDVYQALFKLEGRSCALLLKELARAGLQFRANELFDWLRALESAHPLTSLLDVYSYTAAISLCISDQDVERALALANEMKTRKVERNVHTYTALMNVCIKCSKHAMALETFKVMQADGCTPNVVTYNTLIDVHGKMGAWEDATGVLEDMRVHGVEPVLRTYNTLLIACNMCNQPREAVAVYKRMLDDGFSPNSTTYNALISAYGKAGQLDKVMEVFQEMTYRGCERSVITYSSLISACEKAGQWELALELFQEMLRERCTPNTVTFNSLITALAQGAQWERARDMFEQMQAQGCTPDVVTYTALISVLEKGGQWRLALGAFDRMKRQGCKGDAIVYNAIIDALWETGVIWAQRRALSLFKLAVDEGHFHQGRLAPGLVKAEVNLHAMTAGVAVLSLYAWVMSLRKLATTHGPGAVPSKLAIVTDRGRCAKEQGNLVVKEAMQALVVDWGAPFKVCPETGHAGTLEASGPETLAWLLSDSFEARLFAFFPCTDVLPSVANGNKEGAAGSAALAIAALDDFDFSKEGSVEQRCADAFAAVRHFEKTHCLALQNMGYPYLHRRTELVATCIAFAQRLGIKDEAGSDGVLLMDRVMSTSLQLTPELLDLLAVASVIIAAKQVDGPNSTTPLPGKGLIEAASGMPAPAVEQMEWNIRGILGQDTAAISGLRCLKLYLERMGAHHMDSASAKLLAGASFELITDCLSDIAFLNCRPSVIAAAVLYVDRRSRGVIPFWPTMLAKLTGYQDMSTPELSVAIKAAQRIAGRHALLHRAGSTALASSSSGSASASSVSLAASSVALSSSTSSSASSAGSAHNGHQHQQLVNGGGALTNGIKGINNDISNGNHASVSLEGVVTVPSEDALLALQKQVASQAHALAAAVHGNGFGTGGAGGGGGGGGGGVLPMGVTTVSFPEQF